MRVAVLDDDQAQLDLAQQTLETMGHDFHGYTDGKTLLRALRRETYDLLILDWQLPDISGIQVMRWVRENLEERVPILFVTNRSAEADVIEGLSAGADDFMVKPIRVGELTARVNALLRRAYHLKSTGEVVIDRYRFDTASGTIHLDGRTVVLKQKEFDLALFLFQNLGRLLSRKHLLEAVWGIEAEVSSRSLDTHISRLRTKLGLVPEQGYRLAAIYSVGYRLEALNPGTATPAGSDAG
ncbi:MAG TPA: response regulator transcription factor [Burkholderiaceae bacterium]|nr:response regulator transcription factor [Burkholderiaceae bacterium]